MRRFLSSLTEQEAQALDYDWGFWGRPQQQQPDWDWFIWLLCAGRGFGKTRTGAETVRAEVEAGRAKRIALIGATAADVRDVMIEGPSGLLEISPPWCRPKYEPAKRRVTWPNGAVATCYSAEKPARLRGPNHDFAWLDELGCWRYPEAYDQVMLTLRHGSSPRAVITTTPRPTQVVRDLFARRHDLPAGILGPRDVHLTRGSTYDNLENLAARFIAQIRQQYEGTTLGRQELWAELLDEVQGALWTLALIALHRVKTAPKDLTRKVIAIDPAASSGPDSDETGIVAAGRGRAPDERQGPALNVFTPAQMPVVRGTMQPRLPILGLPHGYMLEDRSGRYKPGEWGRIALDLAAEIGADAIVAEANQGGEMVEHVIRAALRPGERCPRIKLIHARDGKATRAQPIAALYEQGRFHHVGVFPKLEDQMSSWVPGISKKSPDRMDAAVYAGLDLFPNESLPQSHGTRPEGW